MKRLSLTAWIFIGMAAGVALGVFAPHFASQLGPSNIFLRLIRSIIAPLLFATLVYGIAGSGVEHMGRIGAKAILYFETVTTLALFLGLGAVNLLRPGDGVPIQRSAADAAVPAAATTLGGFLSPAFSPPALSTPWPATTFSSWSSSPSCSASPAPPPAPRPSPSSSSAASPAEVMFRYTKYVMYLAPNGVGAAIAVTIGSKGIGVMFGLGKLVLAMYAAAALCFLLILAPALPLFRIPYRAFWRAIREPFLIAFSTASSEAALPSALENMEAFGVPKHIVGFVIPTGYSFNLVGTALYLSLASVFVAQAAGVHPAFSEQLTWMLMFMLVSKGAAGVPRASLVILAATLPALHLPLEGVAVLLGVDAILDMARTALNVTGNCLAAAVVARWEGYKVG